MVKTGTHLHNKRHPTPIPPPLQAPLSDEQLGSEGPPPGTDYNFISLWLKGEPEGVYGVSEFVCVCLVFLGGG